MIKKVKNQDTEENNANKKESHNNGDSHDELITVKGKKEVLEGLVIKPNIVGKKTVGNLEIHQNGVRFTS